MDKVKEAVMRLRDSLDAPRYRHEMMHSIDPGFAMGGGGQAYAVQENPVRLEDVATVLLAIYDRMNKDG